MFKVKLLRLTPLLLGMVLLTFGPFLLRGESSVRVWEEPLVIPTYLTGKPDLFPIFYGGRAYQGAKGPVYPYPLLDKLTDVRENKNYNAIYLENDFIKISVIPELGGRIFSALDKTNNYDFFYRQSVIKPALIGMLGTWLSGGVEWNFPHHHRATSFMPVDHTITENRDGSKTIWIGEIELRHRMKWIIGLTLYPDRSYIEATIKLFNRTPFVHSFLCWANVAVHTNEDYQVIFPPSTEFATYHGKNQFSQWPISSVTFNRVDYSKGVDVRWWKNHPSPTSFFAWNCEEDFLAGYDHGKEAGVVHVADRHIVPGKKFWTWGTGSQAKMWEKILTDTDGPYIELMVGAFSDNQPDYSWLQPYEVRTIKQYWFPLRKIKGVKKANLEAAVNLELTSGNTVQIGLNTTSVHRRARVVLEAKEEVIFEQKIDIGPNDPFLQEMNLPSEVNKYDLRIVLFSPADEELISYQPVKKKEAPMPEPVKPPPPPKKIKTIEELILSGLRLEQFHNPAVEPYLYYEEALRRDPGDFRANTALGILYCKRGMFEEAAQRLHTALKRNTYNYTRPKDGEAYYYLGVALWAQGRLEAAFDALYKASWSQAWSSSSYFSLAGISCLKGDLQKALDYLDRSLRLNSLNTKALNLKSALLRRTGELKEAEKIAAGVLSFDPLDFWAGNELYLIKSSLGKQEEAAEVLDTLLVKMRDEVQSYLEMAVDYGNCGLWDEAIEALSRLSDSERSSASLYPMIYYYLGFYLDKAREEEKAFESFMRASRMPPDYCFPFRLESIEVLSHAQERNPQDSRAPYYLGNLLYDIQPERAIEEWEKSAALDDEFSVLHRNLGLAYARVKNDIPKAIKSLEKALKHDRSEPRLYYELDLLYESGGKPLEERLALLEKNHDVVCFRDDALSREITLLVQKGKYDRAIVLLEEHHFHVWEGGGRIHNVYVDAHLLRGQKQIRAKDYKKALQDFKNALEYPENLEVGRPLHGGRASQVQYFIGTAYEALGNSAKAEESYEKSVAQKRGLSDLSYYQGLAFLKMNRKAEANRLFEGLINLGLDRLQQSSGLDFFAKFGEKQRESRRRAHVHYLLGLGYLGKGKKTEAIEEFRKTIELNLNHLWAQHQLKAVNRK